MNATTSKWPLNESEKSIVSLVESLSGDGRPVSASQIAQAAGISHRAAKDTLDRGGVR